MLTTKPWLALPTQELFGAIGRLHSASLHFDDKGNSLGTATVTYTSEADAIKAVEKYNDVPLDGWLTLFFLGPFRFLRLELSRVMQGKQGRPVSFAQHGWVVAAILGCA